MQRAAYREILWRLTHSKYPTWRSRVDALSNNVLAPASSESVMTGELRAEPCARGHSFGAGARCTPRAAQRDSAEPADVLGVIRRANPCPHRQTLSVLEAQRNTDCAFDRSPGQSAGREADDVRDRQRCVVERWAACGRSALESRSDWSTGGINPEPHCDGSTDSVFAKSGWPPSG
jgi:hypothetical protein